MRHERGGHRARCGLTGLTILAMAMATPAAAATPQAAGDTGNVAWMLVATLLVLMMAVPGVALFYGGLVRSKNVLSVLAQVLCVLAMALLAWMAYGYSLAFSGGGAVLGNLHEAFLLGITPTTRTAASSGLPTYLYFAFQATFAGVSCALVVGALAERVKFGALLLFTLVWFTLAYVPIAHMVWAPNGWLHTLGALDYAGGTVVHINAGVAGLVGAALLGPRMERGRSAMRPHNLPLAMLGATLLWVGWFGFNAGSALAADGMAVLAFVNTLLAGAAGIMTWVVAEMTWRKQPSLLGGISGLVAGLVGVTPACGSVGPLGAIVVGAVASAVCLWGVNGLKHWLGVDDALDAFGIHAVGGIVGGLLTGVFSASALGGTGLAGHTWLAQLGLQALAVLVTVLWSGGAALLAGWLVRRLVGLRVSEDHERTGLDTAVHGERAYDA